MIGEEESSADASLAVPRERDAPRTGLPPSERPLPPPMIQEDRENLTRVLTAAAAGDRQASEELFPLVYDELRRMAAARMSRLPAGQTLQATALVHEAYLRVARTPDGSWEGRSQFLAAASRAMRNILVDAARRKASLKRGANFRRVELEFAGFVIEPPREDILAVDEALKILEREDPEKAQIVQLRYFIGLSVAETAEALGLSQTTVERRWRFIRAWLRRHLSEFDLSETADG